VLFDLGFSKPKVVLTITTPIGLFTRK